MSDPENNDEIFALMRKHFTEDPEENLEALREAAASLSQDPQGALKKALLVLHNMKGSAQTVGFSWFAALLHEMEEVLGSISIGTEFDRAFSSLIDAVEVYFHQLGESLEDKPGLDHDCQQKLKELRKYCSPPSPQPSAAWGLFDEAPKPTAATEPTPPPAAVEEKKPVEYGKYLLLEQNERLFAIHLDEVKEIVSDHYLNPLPIPQKGMKGMIVVRNRALPVLDLGSMMDDHADDRRICAVICESEDQSFAFRVQNPRQVISLAQQDFESVSEKTAMPSEQQALIKNVARYNGQSVLIVDLRSMLHA